MMKMRVLPVKMVFFFLTTLVNHVMPIASLAMVIEKYAYLAM
jgi:hypothetical protein